MALLALSAAVCQAQSAERVDTLATSVVTAYHSGGTLSRGQDLRTEIINSAGLLGRTFFGMHLIGFQKSRTCILSDFKKMFSAFYRNSDIFTTFVSTI